jgi:hypothetical protein
MRLGAAAPSLPGAICARTFAICAKRPGPVSTGSDEGETRSQAWTPPWPRMAVRLALWRPTHGEPEARALHHVPEADGGIRARGPAKEGLEG